MTSLWNPGDPRYVLESKVASAYLPSTLGFLSKGARNDRLVVGAKISLAQTPI